LKTKYKIKVINNAKAITIPVPQLIFMLFYLNIFILKSIQLIKTSRT
jgi:hypothetical protein